MLPGRVASLAIALIVVLDASAHAQPPEIPAAPDFPGPAPVLDSPPPPNAESNPARGWFAGLSAFAVRPEIYFATKSSVSKEVQPYAHWTVSPEVTLGYQSDGGDAWLVSYRYLGSSGVERNDFYTLRIPLDSHWLDLDYRSCLYHPLPTLSFQWQAGCRLAVIDQDSRYDSSNEASSFDNTFFGAGPHLGTSLTWTPWQARVGFFARTDVGFLIGEGWYEERYHLSGSSGSQAPSSTTQDYHYSQRKTRLLLNPRVEAGVCREVTAPWRLSFEAGVRLDDFIESDDPYKLATIIHNLGPFCRFTLQY